MCFDRIHCPLQPFTFFPYPDYHIPLPVSCVLFGIPLSPHSTAICACMQNQVSKQWWPVRGHMIEENLPSLTAINCQQFPSQEWYFLHPSLCMLCCYVACSHACSQCCYKFMCVMALSCPKEYCLAANVRCFKLLQSLYSLQSIKIKQGLLRKKTALNGWVEWLLIELKEKLICKGTQSSKSSDLGKWSLGSSWTSVFNQKNQVKKKWSSILQIFRNIFAMENLLKEQI